MFQKKKVIILGGGFAGVNVALELLRWAPKKVKISLVDKRDYHLFAPGLFKAATSNAEPSFIFYALAFKFEEIFKYKNIDFFKKEIKEIDFKNNEVFLKGNKVLDYDYLVLAPGMESDFKKIDGAEQYALPLKTYEDAIKIKSFVEEVFENKPKREKINILIAGAGLTGVEIAGQINCCLGDLAEKHGHPKESIKLMIVEGGGKICGFSGKWMQKQTKNRLKSIGVEVLLNTKIKEIKKNQAVFGNGKVVACDVFIWAAGATVSSFFKNLELSVNNSLRVGRYKNVFALGDVCCGELAVGTRGCTAQSAISQAKYVGREILRTSKALPPLLWNIGKAPDYKPIKPKFINAIGYDFALADLGFFKFKGRLANLMKNMAYLDYFTRVLPWRKAFKKYKQYKSL